MTTDPFALATLTPRLVAAGLLTTEALENCHDERARTELVHKARRRAPFCFELTVERMRWTLANGGRKAFEATPPPTVDMEMVEFLRATK